VDIGGTQEDITLIYDGECPICCRYSAYVRLRQRMEIALVDARQTPEIVADLKSRGYDLNQGMALLWGPRVYLGKKALVVLDSLTYARGIFDVPVRFVIRIPGAVSLLYPVCKLLRLVLLRLLGKNPDLHRLN